jgi:hypothetical protein
MLIMSAGTGSYPTEPHGIALEDLGHTRHNRRRHWCGSGSGCIIAAAMQQPMATTNVIVIRETHIPPSFRRRRRNPYPNAEVAGWFRDVTGWRLEKSADCCVLPNYLFSLANSANPLLLLAEDTSTKLDRRLRARFQFPLKK